MNNPNSQSNIPGDQSTPAQGGGNMLPVIFAIVLIPLAAVFLFGMFSGPIISGGDADGATVTTASGLKYIDLKVGDGTAATPGDTVTVHYTGILKDGKKFDSSLDRDEPFTFKLGARKVIKGWDEGVAGMKEGGVRKLIIPHELAYGIGGSHPKIPPRAELTFDVELISVK